MDSGSDVQTAASTGGASSVLPSGVETVATQTEGCEEADDSCNGATLVGVPLVDLDLGMDMDGEEYLNRTMDYEYEEVILTRAGVDQKVGLTLCYGSAFEEITDIFVGEVDPLGIAAKDGRIREGDQILQINSRDVHTRHEAVRMFSDSKATIALLVARPSIQLDDGFMDIYNSLDELRNRLDGTEAEGVLGPAPSKSTSNETTSEHPAPKQLRPNDVTGNSPPDFRWFANHRSRSHDEANVDHEIDSLNRQMSRLQLHYHELLEAAHHRVSSSTDGDRSRPTGTPVPPPEAPSRTPRLVPRMGTRLDGVRQLHMAPEHLSHVTQRRCSPAGGSEQDTSAYNTGGESCRSTPSAGGIDAPPEETATTQTGNDDGEARSRSRTSQTTDHRLESLQRLYNQYIDVMYTNKANLQHTITVQQNLFQQQLGRQSPGKPKNSKALPDIPRIPCPSGTVPKGGEMEWVVKRRADGTRYITRRPKIRTRMLKERARKLTEERRGMTTDDDDVSELKIGRYWSKEERKRHLEKARNHRRQRELLVKQQVEEGNRGKVDAVVRLEAVDLGQRKHLKHRSRRPLEDFASVQELLVHGSRDEHGKTYNALLSVTTV